MLILAIDSTTQVSSVALANEDKLLGELTTQKPQKQLTWIMPAIKQLLLENKVDFSELQGIAVTTGPGSYTGIRLGLATAKTIAQVLDLDLVGFNTLDILAQNASNFKGFICPVLDAKKGEVYTAVYKSSSYVESPRLRQDKTTFVEPHRISQYFLLKAEEFSDWLNNQDKKVIILGTGLNNYKDLWIKDLKTNYTLASEDKWYPKASELVIKACKEFTTMKKKYFQLEAFYLRKPDTAVS